MARTMKASHAAVTIAAVFIAALTILSVALRPGFPEYDKMVAFHIDSNDEMGPTGIASRSAGTSARQVPTGPNPIHHNNNPVRPKSP